MTGIHPRKGDIYRTSMGTEYEITAPVQDGKVSYRLIGVKRWPVNGRCSVEVVRRHDQLVSYMPDPTDPQPGDRFKRTAGANKGDSYTILAIAPNGAYNGNLARIVTDSGERVGWSVRSVVSVDTPLRTLVAQAEPVNTCAPAQPPVEHGGLYAAASWPPEKFVKVDWIGDDGFGGRVYLAEPGADAERTIKLTLQPSRKTFGFSGTVWSPWKPAPVEPPKPVVKKWEVTTEERKGRQGEVEIAHGEGAFTPFARGLYQPYGLHSIVTAVKPLDPARIKTVWRVPVRGDWYISNGELVKAFRRNYEDERQVLVVG